MHAFVSDMPNTTAAMTVGVSGIAPPEALRVLRKTIRRNAAGQGGRRGGSEGGATGNGSGASNECEGTETIILLLDPRISSRRREEIGDVFKGGLRSTGEKDSADRAVGGVEVDKEKILMIRIVNGDPHGSVLLDSISHSTGVDGDILGRIMADSVKLSATYNTIGHIRFLEVTLERFKCRSSRDLILDKILIVLVDMGVEVGDDHTIKGKIVGFSTRTSIYNPESVETEKEDLEILHKLGPIGPIEDDSEDISQSCGDRGWSHVITGKC
ncbi:hypothetical protein R3P38DRAFT_3096489, partial [Favolaschia claudopus]